MFKKSSGKKWSKYPNTRLEMMSIKTMNKFSFHFVHIFTFNVLRLFNDLLHRQNIAYCKGITSEEMTNLLLSIFPSSKNAKNFDKSSLHSRTGKIDPVKDYRICVNNVIIYVLFVLFDNFS
jgi:hypothetical protein